MNLQCPKRDHFKFGLSDIGPIRLGMFSDAHASNRIFAFAPKRVGRDIEIDRSCATIERSKWVDPARAAFDGIVQEINEGLIDKPTITVDQPYDAAWMMIARPARSDVFALLATGDAIQDADLRWMEDNNFPGCEAGR